MSIILGDWDKLLPGGSSWVILMDIPQAQRNLSFLREIQHIQPLQITRRGCPELRPRRVPRGRVGRET